MLSPCTDRVVNLLIVVAECLDILQQLDEKPIFRSTIFALEGFKRRRHIFKIGKSKSERVLPHIYSQRNNLKSVKMKKYKIK